jgi:hypothetical protein
MIGMTKYLVLSTFLLAGCSGDEPSIVEETDSMVIEETAATETSTDETATTETGDETMEAGTDAPIADAPITDAGGDARMDAPADSGGGGITCGTTSCNATTQACCVPTTGGAPSCIAKADSCAGGKLACTAPDTCGGGQKCCLGTAGTLSGSTCKASCTITEDQLCDSDSDCTGGDTCKNLGGSPGLKHCT